MSRGLRLALGWISGAAETVVILALACVAFALDVDASDESKHFLLEGAVRFAQEHATEIGVSGLAFFAAGRLGKWLFAERSEDTRIVDRLVVDALDEFRLVAFGRQLSAATPPDHNRVTYFRHRHFVWWIWPFRGIIWPWGKAFPGTGWLVIAYRSGHLTKRARTVFLAPDHAADCEGVAGQAYRRGALRAGKAPKKLPDLSTVSYTGYWKATLLQMREFFGSTKPSVLNFAHERQLVHAYAEATYTSSRQIWYRLGKKRPCPTSILGIQLRDHHNRPVGALVMDSCNEHECIDSDSTQFKQALTKLTKKLRRIERLTYEGS